MGTNETTLLFFAGALFLLSLCALSINVGSRDSVGARATRWAWAAFGIVPGLAMVLSGAVVQFASAGDRTGLGMVSAGLLLEMGGAPALGSPQGRDRQIAGNLLAGRACTRLHRRQPLGPEPLYRR